MMSATTSISKGSKDLVELLDIIKNADTFQERLAELVTAEREANAAIKNLTKAKDLDKALADAEDHKIQASILLENAKVQAETLKAEAEKEVEEIKKEKEGYLELELNEAKEIKKEAIAQKKKADQIEEDALKKLSESHELKEMLLEEKKELDLKAEALKKKAKTLQDLLKD